ncbi:MAG: hypothetical protein JNL82_36395 [Myxococcales bacterium]|nr:hypothetical protein [Myxococcales bacterium]
MSRALWITLGTTLGVGGAVFLGSRRASAASSTTPGGTGSTPVPGTELDPLPTADDAAGDLVTNWGDTPADLRPLLDKMQTVSRIAGSARIFAVIAFRESQFITTAHNGNAEGEQDERDDSRAAYKNNKDRNPLLKYGEQAAEFGSGGLFGALAPYFLWTGVPEIGKKAPLLQSPPELVFQPRVAAFAACVYLQRLLANYRIDDHADIKVGWASPSLLKSGRGNEQYNHVRARFFEDAINLGIDLLDESTIPQKLSASAWPGVPAVWKALVGELPKEVA